MDTNKLFEIGLKKRNKELTESWKSLAEKYSNGLFGDGESFRIWVKNRVRSQDSKKEIETLNQTQKGKVHEDTIEIHKDGSQSSNRLVRMSIEDTKDVSFLLKAHGYDTGQWELISAKSNIWHVYSQKDGINTLYSSKITVRPKTNGFCFDKLLEEIHKQPPVYIRNNDKHVDEKRLLEIPFFDSHFGVSDYNYYKQTQDETIDLITSKKWEQILFIIGQDMLHNDNFKGQTSNGTSIEKVDMVKAWRDAKKFYYPMIEEAIANSNDVKVVYSKGNHDETMSWSFVQLLMERYPQVTFDDSFIERKAHTFGEIFIGITHGDKARKNLHNLFQTEYPMEWAQAKTREVHCGHIHIEEAKDVFGMMIRTLSTRNKTDEWHKNHGFVGAHKRFILFEYTEHELKGTHYV